MEAECRNRGCYLLMTAVEVDVGIGDGSDGTPIVGTGLR